MQHTTRVFGALLGAILTAGAMACSDDDGYGGTEPNPNTDVSAEDKALAITGISLKKQGTVQILRATGDITTGVAQYRALLGEPLNGAVSGEQPAGRRDINWDGVPPAFTNIDVFPGDFFNARSARGALIVTSGTGLRVSDNGFTDVNAGFTGAFNTFSPVRTFSSIGSTTMEVRFVVAGSATPALVTGFGAVFAGVDRSLSATIEYYDAAGRRLATVAAPRRVDDKGLSFAGTVFDKPTIAYVRIISGDAPISSTASTTGTGKSDLAVLDDFIYGEPHAKK